MPGTARNFRLSPKARRDLEGIFEYSVEVWSVDQASRYNFEIQHAIQLVADAPRIGRGISEIRPGYYLYRVRSHLIVYRLIEQGIEVVRVLHQRMDISRHL